MAALQAARMFALLEAPLICMVWKSQPLNVAVAPIWDLERVDSSCWRSRAVGKGCSDAESPAEAAGSFEATFTNSWRSLAVGNGLPVADSLAEAAGILVEASSCCRSSAEGNCLPEAETSAEAAGFVKPGEDAPSTLAGAFSSCWRSLAVGNGLPVADSLSTLGGSGVQLVAVQSPHTSHV